MKSSTQNKPVGVCGEMAGDPASALLLIGLGVDSLSMTPSSLPRIKWTIRSVTMQQARGLADKALKINNEADTHQLLNRALKTAGLNALVRENWPHKSENGYTRNGAWDVQNLRCNTEPDREKNLI